MNGTNTGDPTVQVKVEATNFRWYYKLILGNGT
jgi:hypothetical protein